MSALGPLGCGPALRRWSSSTQHLNHSFLALLLLMDAVCLPLQSINGAQLLKLLNAALPEEKPKKRRPQDGDAGNGSQCKYILKRKQDQSMSGAWEKKTERGNERTA